MIKFVYKICYFDEWKKFKKNKIYNGSKKDISDGYIHFSNKNQIKSTLNKYFSKKDKLVLLKVNIKNLKNLIWEKSSGGKLFPHLYSLLTIKDVKSIDNITFKKNNFLYKKIL